MNNLYTIGKVFWKYFKQCPKKACLSYRRNPSFGIRFTTYKFISIEDQKYKIFEYTANMFFKEIMENKQITYTKLKEYFYFIITKEEKLMRKNSKYSEEYKDDFFKMIEQLKNFVDFNKFAKLLNVKDAINMNIGFNTTINLTDYINMNYGTNSLYKIKTRYDYSLEVPYYNREDDKVNAIIYLSNGYPYNIPEIEPEINLVKAFFNKCTDETLNKIIVYDFKTMVRYEVTDLKPTFAQVFKAMKVLDMDFLYSNNSYENCRTCPHIDRCRDVNRYTKSFEEILKESKEKIDDNKKKNQKQKKKSDSTSS